MMKLSLITATCSFKSVYTLQLGIIYKSFVLIVSDFKFLFSTWIFSNFKPDYDNDCYEAAPRHGLIKSLNLPKPIKRLYDEYFNAVKNARMLIYENRFRYDSL